MSVLSYLSTPINYISIPIVSVTLCLSSYVVTPITYACYYSCAAASFLNNLWQPCFYAQEIINYNNGGFKEIKASLLGPERKNEIQYWMPAACRDLAEVMDREKITLDVNCCESVNRKFMYGSIRNKKAGLIITPMGSHKEFSAMDKFFSLHELGHIKHEDDKNRLIVGLVTSMVAFLYGSSFCSHHFTALISTLFITKIATTVFHHVFECKADDFGISHASDEELLAGRRGLIALQEMNKSNRNALVSSTQFNILRAQYLVVPDGEILDFSHPFLKRRIQKIERALEQRKITIDHEKELIEIEKITSFFLNWHKNGLD